MQKYIVDKCKNFEEKKFCAKKVTAVFHRIVFISATQQSSRFFHGEQLHLLGTKKRGKLTANL